MQRRRGSNREQKHAVPGQAADDCPLFERAPMPLLNVKVWRGTADGRFVAYQVPCRDEQTVLDLVMHIQRRIDPTLSYRHACRIGKCGSCAVAINGVARWACRTQAIRVTDDGELEIAPLSHLPVIKDLVTDMQPFFDKWQQAGGPFQGGATRRQPLAVVPPRLQRPPQKADDECIGCGICHASCDVVAWRADYLGPAALHRAWALVHDGRDTALARRLRAVAGDAGCLSCHGHTACSARCPKGLDPAAAITGLKRMTALALLRRTL